MTRHHRLATPLPQSVIDRFYAEHPEEDPANQHVQGSLLDDKGKIAGKQHSYYVTQGGGKYHRSNPITGQALCNGTVLVDTNSMPIVRQSDSDTKPHPILCKRCLPRS